MTAQVHEITQAIPMSWEDFLARDDHGEYIDGMYIPRSMVTGKHQQLARRLANLFDAEFNAYQEWGWRPTSAQRKYSPDVMVVARQYDEALAAAEGRQYWTGPVELLVEVLSKSNASKDWVRNLNDYARFGAPQYWIVSQADEAIYVFELVDGVYVENPSAADRLLPAAERESIFRR